jgi:hypothetical protein
VQGYAHLLDSYICFFRKYDKVYILEGERKNICPGPIFLVQIRPRKPHVTRVQPPNTTSHLEDDQKQFTVTKHQTNTLKKLCLAQSKDPPQRI